MWEIEVTRYIGAAISFGGVAVASPPGTRLAVAAARGKTRETWARTAQVLRKVFRRPPRNIMLHVDDTLQVQTSAVGTWGFTGSASGQANLDIDVRVRLLEEHLQRVDESLAHLQHQATEDRIAHQTALIEVRHELVTGIAALNARLDASEDRAMQTDARALLIAVVGILLLNFAAEVALLPFVLWLLAVVGSVALCARLGRDAWRAGTPPQDGSAQAA